MNSTKCDQVKKGENKGVVEVRNDGGGKRLGRFVVASISIVVHHLYETPKSEFSIFTFTLA